MCRHTLLPVSYTHLDVYKRQIRSGYVKISYKNRNGVRKEAALDWRELYEILSYMVKQPFYCGEDQKKYYQETKQKADRDKTVSYTHLDVYKRQVDVDNRFTVYGIRDLGTELSPITMLVMMESIQNRIVENGKMCIRDRW